MPAKCHADFTVEHFAEFASRIVLDTQSTCVLEEFQLQIVKPILAGVRETWIVIPEGCGKTSLMALVALYHAHYTHSPWVPIAASSRDQAEILARQAYGMIRDTPGLQRHFKIFEGYREIRSIKNGGRGIKVYAADAKTGDGVIPTLAICDEGHRWDDLALYRLWRGKLRKRRGQIVMISTAGEPGSDFEETRDRIRDSLPHRESNGAYLRAWKAGLEFHEWMVRNPADYKNMEKVKEANPFSEVTVDTLMDEWSSPTNDEGEFQRLKCNIPSRKRSAAITEQEWDSAEIPDRIPAGVHVDVGLDVAWKHDTTAFVPCFNDVENGCRVLGEPTLLTPPGDGSMIDVDDLKRAFADIYDRNPVDTVVMDTSNAKDVEQWLVDEYDVEAVEAGQGNAMAAEYYEQFMEALRNGILKHTGSPVLRRHVMNAIARDLPGEKRRFDRPSSSRAKRKQQVRVIDALTAASMVNWYQAAFEAPSEPLVAWR